MTTVAKEIMNLARKAGYEGEDKTNVVKAIDALADTLAGENLEQATNVAAAIKKLQPYVGGGGGNPYEYLGIEFITIDIDSHTLPTVDVDEQLGPIELETISAKSTISDQFSHTYFQILPSVENGINQIIVPIASGKTTQVYIEGESNYGLLVPKTITVTGDISFVDGMYLNITGPGSITNITWVFAD